MIDLSRLREDDLPHGVLERPGVGAWDRIRRTSARPMQPEEAALAWRPHILGWSLGILWFYERCVGLHGGLRRPDGGVWRLPKGATCVEVGVFHGRSLLYLAELLRSVDRDAGVEGVDPCEYYACSYEAILVNAWDVLGGWGYGGPQVLFHREPGSRLAERIPDASRDLVFIDADHSEGAVAADIAAWLPKVKPGGILAGHDYDEPGIPGVRAAVDRLLPGVKIEPGTVWVHFVPETP